MSTRWITLLKAAELTGLSESFLDERTGHPDQWPEGVVWKWFEGRKMIDSQALDELIDSDGNSNPPNKLPQTKALPAVAIHWPSGITPPFLLAEEVANLCAPLTQGHAQARHLCAVLGVRELPFRPDGSPIVSRKLVEERLVGKSDTYAHNGPKWTK